MKQKENSIGIKFSWGTGIFIFLIVFVLLAISFVIFSLQYDVNLVRDDYYEKGANYTKTMQINQRSLNYQNSIFINKQGSSIYINFPDELANKDLKEGEILFFRPSDRKKDLAFALKIENGRMKIENNNFIFGRYLVKISWKYNKKKYFVEKEYIVK